MKLIVGLRNPGEKYKNTRHNAGWIVLEWFVGRGCSHCLPRAQSRGENCWSENKKLRSSICRLSDTIFAKPLTFMNSSGEAVKKLVDYYKISLGDLLVIHDDLDLPLGEYRLQKGRGAAGHKGVQSVIDCLDSQDFWRLRVGIGRPSADIEAEDYVLQEFSEEELKVLEELFEKSFLSELQNWLPQ